MGRKSIPTRVNGQQMDDSWFNVLRAAITQDIVPRSSSTYLGADLSGSLGLSSYQFLKAFIGAGYWETGDIKLHHSYNGLVTIGEGWMLCDGRTISEANYNTEHGAAHWATYVVSSALNGKKLPDFTSRFAMGVSATTQDGSASITAVGNNGNALNLQHNHQMYYGNGGLSADAYYDSSGVTHPITQGTAKNAGIYSLIAAAAFIQHFYSENQLSTSQSIRPESMEFQFYMRII